MTLSITDMIISNQCKSGSSRGPKKEIHKNKKISKSESFRSVGAQDHHAHKSHVREKKRRNPIDNGSQIPSEKIPIKQPNILSIKEDRKTTAVLTEPRKKRKFNRNQEFLRPSHNSSNTLAHPSYSIQKLPGSLQSNDVSFGIQARSSDVSEGLGGPRLGICGNRRFQQGGPNKAYSRVVEPSQHRLEMSNSDTSQSAPRRFFEMVPPSSFPEESFLTETNNYPVVQEETEKVSEGQSMYFVEAVIMQSESPWQQWSAGTSVQRRPRLG
ncbi:hypothetical protein BKA69DRAFT_390154 [Paraphysoderma sedebokerense]|nr:hypothetical protein BKA69DRAFT_390154 [Paraphysoderma sedebokerense]